ncbi:MAG: 50S ribosomal protein L17 [Ignavibacteria bacterium]|nr:50S ribosomal protein L17 [Ignavibacteria bacterium]
MRHNKEGRKLKRTASHRRALLSALSTALIKHKKITTTTAKAKETRRIVEPIITRARDAYQSEKSGGPVDVHARRVIARFIHDETVIHTLFNEVAEKVGKRAGGYTRVLPLGRRLGDAAEMSIIELVDYNVAQDTKKRKSRVEGAKAAQARRKAAEERKASDEPKKTKAPKAEAAAVQPAPEAEIAPAEPVVETPDAPETEATDDAKA